MDETKKGKLLKTNTVCGNVTGPGETGGVYVVHCQEPIEARYITIQIIKPGRNTLRLTEIQVDEGI